MKSCAILLSLLVVSSGFANPSPEAVRSSQRIAVEAFPELGVKGSPLNRRFLERLEEYRGRNSEILDRPDWPYRIAQQCEKELRQLRLEEHQAKSEDARVPSQEQPPTPPFNTLKEALRLLGCFGVVLLVLLLGLTSDHPRNRIERKQHNRERPKRREMGARSEIHTFEATVSIPIPGLRCRKTVRTSVTARNAIEAKELLLDMHPGARVGCIRCARK